jgi:cytosolic carboxypeptidase protein 2/3
VYDLVLQNDLNTRGFTQWYNFKVTNRRNNFVAKFNIVNLVTLPSRSISPSPCTV